MKADAIILEKLWMEELRRLLGCERQSLKLLPKARNNASSPNLTSVIEGYIEITRQQIIRIEQIFGIKNSKARGRKSIAVQRLINEGQNVLYDTILGPVRDVALIATVQKIIHYQISLYDSLAAWSHKLNENRIGDMLAVASDEEKTADHLFSEAAITTINYDAAIDENRKKTTSRYNPKL